MRYSTDDPFVRNLDAGSPDQYLLVGAPDSRGVSTCYVHVPDTPKAQGRVFRAIGRTARYEFALLLSTKHFVPVPRPFVIRRDDGHEIFYG